MRRELCRWRSFQWLRQMWRTLNIWKISYRQTISLFFVQKKTLISSPKISLATKNSAHVFSNFGKDCVGSDSMARANHVFLTRRPTKVCFESSKAFSALILLYLSQRHLFKSCCREKKPFLFSTNRLQINAAPYAGH